MVMRMRNVMAIEWSWCFSAEMVLETTLPASRLTFFRHRARKSEPARGLLIFQFRPFRCVDTIQ